MLLRLSLRLLSAVVWLSASSCNADSGTNFDKGTKPNAIDVYEQNAKLAQSVNLGNALEAPNEGDWGVYLQENYFKEIKAKNFTAVRIPIRWSAHAANDSPYTIDSEFAARVDWAIGQAFKYNLAAVINIHHYEAIMNEPLKHKNRLLALWRQIGQRYQNYPEDLFFEVLNEPHNELNPALWNTFLAEAIKLIRKSNARRTLIVGTAEWGGLGALADLVLPQDDNLIVTFHYYNPFEFTHQGAEWVDGSDAWMGTSWTGTHEQKEAVRNDFKQAAQWAATHDVPLFMGEFGAYRKADMRYRTQWTAFVRSEAERHGFSWAYWEFCSGFGIYDASENVWRDSLLNALIPQ
ncbi:MAG: cellulase family glycosylhydrolase [Caldithrix sp.]|nr:cellulase family glycosylhydrolase [Caldithrix sp.]